jgi:dihydropteroate synthase
MTTGAWATSRGPISLDRPIVLGIVNVTPDSFSDGGLHANVEAAVAHSERLVEDGADVLDVGGESTRPGARGVPQEDELARTLPVVRELVRRFPRVPVSIDTVKAEVARAALREGAAIVNDVAGLRLDPALPGVVAEAGAGLVLMHSRGAVGDMASYALADYGPDAVGDVVAELSASVQRARAAGIPDAALVLDPGLGFSKRTEHSIAMLARLDRVLALGFPVLLGPSRKRFLGEVAGGLPVELRLDGTLAACVAGLLAGARLFRVHDVAPVRRALAVAEAIRRAA